MRTKLAIAVLLAAVAAVGITQPLQAQEISSLPDGMDAKTVAAIERGLKYLQRTQRAADGSWLSSGGYGGSYPCVMTSLSGMAFLASGSTPESGPYSKNVRKAMLYMLKVGEASKDGLIASGDEMQSMYGHGFGMLFLAQCYGMDVSRDFGDRIRKVLDKGITLTAKCQSDLGPPKHAGGWIYTPDGRSDEGSVTVTQLQALRAARNVGIKVPQTTIDRAVAYLKHCQMGDGGICYSAGSRGQSRPPISAAGIACFFSAGVYDRAAGGAEMAEETKMVDRLIAYCKKNCRIGQDNGHYYYTHLYYSQGMYQRSALDDTAKKEWLEYYKGIKDWLLEHQNTDGSWSGDGVGNVYGTAIACIILQMPYGYLPVYQR